MFKHTFNFYLQQKGGVPLERYELPMILDGKSASTMSRAPIWIYSFSLLLISLLLDYLLYSLWLPPARWRSRTHAGIPRHKEPGKVGCLMSPLSHQMVQRPTTEQRHWRWRRWIPGCLRGAGWLSRQRGLHIQRCPCWDHQGRVWADDRYGCKSFSKPSNALRNACCSSYPLLVLTSNVWCTGLPEGHPRRHRRDQLLSILRAARRGHGR